MHACSNSATDAADAQGALVRLRNKQTLLDLLCERTRDHSSYTRMAVLQVWEYLAEHRAIPLGHWQVVTGIAAGALRLCLPLPAVTPVYCSAGSCLVLLAHGLVLVGLSSLAAELVVGAHCCVRRSSIVVRL